MKISYLKSFLSVLKAGSFSKAAKACSRSQPAISRDIQSLESELETRLFERFGPMAVKSTREAELLRAIVAPVVGQFESIKDVLDEKRGRSKVTQINIVTHESAKTTFLLDVFAKFQKKHPGIKISLIRKDRKEAVALVMEGQADFGITSLDDVPPGVHHKTFASYSRVLMMPKNHPLAKQKRVLLRDIASYPLILPPSESRIRRIIDKAFKKENLSPYVALEIMGRDSAKAYVSKGLGLSILNSYYITASDLKKIKCLDVSEHFGQTKRGIIQRKDRVLSSLHNALIAGIISEAGSKADRYKG